MQQDGAARSRPGALMYKSAVDLAAAAGAVVVSPTELRALDVSAAGTATSWPGFTLSLASGGSYERRRAAELERKTRSRRSSHARRVSFEAARLSLSG
jgi:hypothetical protein